MGDFSRDRLFGPVLHLGDFFFQPLASYLCLAALRTDLIYGTTHYHPLTFQRFGLSNQTLYFSLPAF